MHEMTLRMCHDFVPISFGQIQGHWKKKRKSFGSNKKKDTPPQKKTQYNHDVLETDFCMVTSLYEYCSLNRHLNNDFFKKNKVV